MFAVSGFADGVGYQLAVGDGGELTGSNRTVGVLLAAVGERLGATPTGPFTTLDLTEPASVLIGLYALTDVREVSGDPPITIPSDPDLIY